MTVARSTAAALALAAAGLIGAAAPSLAAPAVILGGVGQHQTVMSDIHRAQQRNAAALNHVQRTIRANQQRR